MKSFEYCFSRTLIWLLSRHSGKITYASLVPGKKSPPYLWGKKKLNKNYFWGSSYNLGTHLYNATVDFLSQVGN